MNKGLLYSTMRMILFNNSDFSKRVQHSKRVAFMTALVCDENTARVCLFVFVCLFMLSYMSHSTIFQSCRDEANGY